MRSEEEWLKLSGVIVIYRRGGGSGGRRERAEGGQRVRSLVFIPGPETSGARYRCQKGEGSHLCNGQSSQKSKISLIHIASLRETKGSAQREVGPKLRLLLH